MLPDGELVKDLLLPIPPRTWRRPTGVQLKAWTTTISGELTQDRRAWSASVRDVVNSNALVELMEEQLFTKVLGSYLHV